MKKEVTIVSSVCDNCGKPESYCTPCVNCEAEYCFDCSKSFLDDHSVSVYRGNHDYLCKNGCEKPLRGIDSDALIAAYDTIDSLVQESKRFYEHWDTRAKAAELRIEEIKAGAR